MNENNIDQYAELCASIIANMPNDDNEKFVKESDIREIVRGQVKSEWIEAVCQRTIDILKERYALNIKQKIDL